MTIVYLCKQQFCHFCVSVFGRQVKGCEALLGCAVQPGAVLQQDSGNLYKEMVDTCLALWNSKPR